MSLPDYQALMLPLLKLAASGNIRVLEAEKKMGEEFGLSLDERAQLLPSGRQSIGKALGDLVWARLVAELKTSAQKMEARSAGLKHLTGSFSGHLHGRQSQPWLRGRGCVLPQG